MKRDTENWSEIIINNKQLALFLGYYYSPNNNENNEINGWIKSSDNFNIKNRIGIGYNYLCRKHRDLLFHCSWDWLMPIVEKLTKMGYFSKTVIINDKYIFGFNNMPSHENTQLINAVYTACIELVKIITKI